MNILFCRRNPWCLLTLFLIVWSGFGNTAAGQDGRLRQSSFHTLDSAFRYLDFNPVNKGSWFFVTAGDLHYQADGESRGGSYIIDQILSMDPAPDFFLIPGDIVNHMSLAMAAIPSEGDVKIAREEFVRAKKDLDRLLPVVPYYLALGNHDTYPYEYLKPAGRVFYRYFDTVPQFFEHKGDYFMILDNGSHANYGIFGQPEKAQRYYRKHIEADKTVFVVQHFPYVGQNYLAGLPLLLHGLFDGHRGEVWNIVGHDHVDRTRLYLLPHTTTIENTVSEGFTIYCMKNGKVAGRILHPRREGSYTVLPLPEKPQGKVLHPFEDVEGVVWQAVIGRDIGTVDCPYLIRHQANDGVTNWVYTRLLEYRFPYPAGETPPDALALMVLRYFYEDAGNEAYSDNGQVFGSFDGKNWVEMPYSHHVHDVAVYTIPPSLRQKKKEIYIKITGPSFRPPHPAAGKIMDNTIGGFAFIRNK